LIATNLAKIRQRLAGSPAQLVAVSKSRSVSELKEAINAGQLHFGENYLQEALGKITTLNNSELVWHFIGPIQSNKTKIIAQKFDWVHSVDRFKIAKRLNEQRLPNQAKLKVLLQINIDNEASKSGILPTEVDELLSASMALERLDFRGFMCIPKADNSAQSFQQMKKLLDQYPDMDTLSMGMSNDLEWAVQNGATFVRVGTAIFGSRKL
jgi:pyridoxal phosphate enzyme (YggS family)